MRLWRAVHHSVQINNKGELKPGFFRNREGVSCDLSAYTNEERARRGLTEPPRPDYSGLVEFTVAHVRVLSEESDVKHDPLKHPKKNYAHCQFTASLTVGQAKKLIRASTYRVQPNVAQIHYP